MTIATRAGTISVGGYTVNRLGYGAMQITGSGVWGEPPSRSDAIAVLRRAVDLGVNFIDTADSYGPYISEELIREALHPYPADLLIATKGGFVRTGPDQWVPVGRPAYLRQEVEMSLRRLGLDAIGLYQLHRVDPDVPLGKEVVDMYQNLAKTQSLVGARQDLNKIIPIWNNRQDSKFATLITQADQILKGVGLN